MAIEVIKDFDRLDQADSTITLLGLEIDSYVRQLGLQGRVIMGQKQQIENLNMIVLNKEGIITVNAEQVAHWRKQYKKQKRQKIIIGGVAIVVVALALLGG